MSRFRRPYDAVKRVLDIVLSGAGLLVTLPIQILTAVAVLASDGLPVLFRQVRPGRHGQPFLLMKFRTMRPPKSGSVTDADRLTELGRLLRATSLDELPTLWNVLKGDMSLVGPRPLLMEYLELYTPEQARRHEVRPGITGLAQVAGRNEVRWEDRFALDVEYVDTRSCILDARILWQTLATVTSRRGISEPGQATAAAFRGESKMAPDVQA